MPVYPTIDFDCVLKIANFISCLTRNRSLSYFSYGFLQRRISLRSFHRKMSIAMLPLNSIAFLSNKPATFRVIGSTTVPLISEKEHLPLAQHKGSVLLRNNCPVFCDTLYMCNYPNLIFCQERWIVVWNNEWIFSHLESRI